MSRTKFADALQVGSRIRVRTGVVSPDFPDVSFEGWTGCVVETTEKKSVPKLVIEWDDETIDAMPEEYREQCEQHSLFYRMACFEAEQVESIDE